jgi:hypothetical protein
MQSRNQREGRYAGQAYGVHRRTNIGNVKRHIWMPSTNVALAVLATQNRMGKVRYILSGGGKLQVIRRKRNEPRMLDKCEICEGKRGGVPGNENIIQGIIVCDYCHADESYKCITGG